MGFTKGIFMVDNHVYAVAGPTAPKGVDPESRLLYHMDKYGVDVCVLKGVYPLEVDKNKLNADIVKNHPDRFVALCTDVMTHRKEISGEVPWNIDNAVKELDELMSTGLYAGIGEGFPRDRNVRKPLVSWDERLEQICKVLEVCRKYKCPLHYITGVALGSTRWQSDITRNAAHPEYFENGSPMLCMELAAWYPDVPIIMSHGGIEASGYFMQYYDQALYVAAAHRNVFLDVGQWWAELFEKPLMDVNIGAEKLLWGSGWGQGNLVQRRMPGQIPETFTGSDQTRRNRMGPPGMGHTPDIWGWSLTQLGRLNIPQDDMNLILGGNAVHLFKIKTPQPAESLFRRVDRDYMDVEIPPPRFQ